MSSVSPAAGATGVATTTAVSATFSEAMDAATIGASTFELRNAANALVSSSVSYNTATRTATLTPTAALAAGATFTATVRGGGADPRIKDVAGNALAANAAWSFTTASGTGTELPLQRLATDERRRPPLRTRTPVPWSLASSSAPTSMGSSPAVRFYKGANNTGTHVGNLWTSGGALLATATFTGETASGWQQVSFATPVQVTANTVYVASYFAPNGRYAGDNNYFANSGVTNRTDHAVAERRQRRQRCLPLRLQQRFSVLELPVDQLLGRCRVRHQYRP